jgi:hypothetical protein
MNNEKNKIDLSIILPSIHPENWSKIYNGIIKSAVKLRFELIAIGPFFPTKEFENVSNFRFIRDFGSPARCLQMASSLAEGRNLTWCSDDCILFENSLFDAVTLFDQKREIDGMTMLYSEGPNFTGDQHLHPEYWIARTHADNHLPGIKEGWKAAPLFMYKTEYFRQLGGLDCRFEHVNMNTHDLAFKVQDLGGEMFSSPSRIYAANWSPWTEDVPMKKAYEENDLPLYQSIFNDPDAIKKRDVKFDNWKNSEQLWKRRFQKNEQ